MRSTTRLLRAALLVLATLVTAASDASAQSFWDELEADAPEAEWSCYPVPDPALEVRVWERLGDVVLRGADRGLVQDELLEEGPRLVPVLFAILMGEVRDEAGLTTPDPDEPQPVRAGAPRVEDLVHEALARQPGDVVAEHLRTVVTPDAPPEARLVAARVLARTDAPEALEVMLEVVAGLDPMQLARPYLRGPFGDALGELFARVPGRLRTLDELLEDRHDAVVVLAIEALPVECARESLPVVLAAFGRNPELDLVAMAKLAELAASPQATGDVWSGLECMRILRRSLESKDWKLRRQAAVAAARLHDLESLERLVKMLEDEHRSVQRTALWALQEMTGQAFDGDPRRWSTWMDAERAWYDGPRSEVEWRILSGRDEEVIAGIRELLQHPLYRAWSADLLGPLLVDAPPGVFAAVRTALVQLDSPRAAVHFVPCLDLEDDGVRTSSWQALRSLTALDLPAEREVWERELGI